MTTTDTARAYWNGMIKDMCDETGVHPDLNLVGQRIAHRVISVQEQFDNIKVERDELVKRNADLIARLLACGGL